MQGLERTLLMNRNPDDVREITKPGLRCLVLPQFEAGRALLKKSFAMETNIYILCDIDQAHLHSVGMEHLIQLTVTILGAQSLDSDLNRQFNQNLVMLRDAEQVILLRQDNQIYADCTDPAWEKIWNTAFGKARMPFTHRKLPSLEKRAPHE